MRFGEHIGFYGVNDLVQVMGRGAGSHTYGDTLGTVYQEVRNLHRKYRGLLFRLVKVWHKVHHIFVEIPQKRFLRHLLQTRLSITHGSGAVTFDIAEIAVAIYKGHPFLEILAHDHQCVVDGTVSMGVVFTHGISHDTGALPVRPVIANAQFMHIVKRPALHRLQTVPDIRQRPGDDDAHGIVYKGFLHLLRVFCFDDSIVVHLSDTFPE